MEETLEEVAERLYPDRLTFMEQYRKIEQMSFIAGAKYQAERMYSEEDLIAFMQYIVSNKDLGNTSSVSETTAKYYLEQFKKK
jgi:hypothetical protein